LTSRPEDPALKSLADALRVSFRVLSFLMVLFVILFLATGIESIEPQEQGICKVFGKIVRVAKPGFVYNWPFPVGQIEKVSTQERQILVDDFWMYETAKDKLIPLARRGRRNEGLRPGWDGYLLTADRNLIHIKFTCRYQVRNPVVFASQLQEPEKILRMVLCQAAIQAAATRTADAMQQDPTGFRQEVERRAQAKLDALMPVRKDEKPAIIISDVQLPTPDAKIWPLAAFSAYEAAQKAKSEKKTKIDQARTDANQILISAVGQKHYAELVGTPWNNADIEQQKVKEGKNYNLIAQYGQAQEKLDKARKTAQGPEVLKKLQAEAEALHKKIDLVLTRSTIGGKVEKIIPNAEAEKTRIIQDAERRKKNFLDLYPKYAKAPQIFLETTWAEVLSEILNEPTNTKWYLTPGREGMVIYLNQDPGIAAQIRDYLRKKKKEEEK